MKRYKLVIPEKPENWSIGIYDGLEPEKITIGEELVCVVFDDMKYIIEKSWLVEIKGPPKVLTAEESWEQRCYPDQSEKAATAYISGFDEGDINGQRKERDNHKDLREKVREYINNDEVQFHKSGIHEALERIKPLEK